MMDRFDLEDAISRMLDIDNELEDLIYKVGDDKNKPTEDEILNILIGMKALNQVRYDRLWTVFENLIKHDVIKSSMKGEYDTIH
jgi:hypothetical protein